MNDSDVMNALTAVEVQLRSVVQELQAIRLEMPSQTTANEISVEIRTTNDLLRLLIDREES
jgi:hypothetical protein